MAGKPGRQRDGRLVHRVPGRIVGKLHRLIVQHPRQFLAPMPGIDAPHAGRSIDQLSPLAIDDIYALAGANSAPRLGTDLTCHRPWLNQMPARQRCQPLIPADIDNLFPLRRHKNDLQYLLKRNNQLIFFMKFTYFECPFNQYWQKKRLLSIRFCAHSEKREQKGQ